MLYPIIMAGGSGTRFWPKSRASLPKQLLPITSEKPMIEETIQRLNTKFSMENIFIITSKELSIKMREILPDFPENNYLIEPVGRDTCACAGFCGIYIQKQFSDEDMIALLPADHVIKPAERFVHTLEEASRIAEKHSGFVTIGIKPTFPSCAYGYIEKGENFSERVYKVKRFCEKPDIETAKNFIQTGNFLWNAGIFVCKVKVLLEAMRTHQPDIYKGLIKIQEKIGTPEYEKVLEEIYPTLPKTSIDYGIMEKIDNIFTIEADFQWDDVGSWRSLENHFLADSNGNIIIKGDVEVLDSKGCIVEMGNNKLLALINVENIIIVDTPDVLMICNKDSDQKIKKMIELLRQKGRTHLL